MAEKASGGPVRRVSRACIYCRQRKSKCELVCGDQAPPSSIADAEQSAFQRTQVLMIVSGRFGFGTALQSV
jgi:hypothetical protein